MNRLGSVVHPTMVWTSMGRRIEGNINIVTTACSCLVVVAALVGAHTNLHAQAQERKPPMTDEAYEKTMKQIGSTFRSLQFNNKAMNHVDGAREARRLAAWFGEVQSYWEAKRANDAVGLAREAVKAAEIIEKASTVMNMGALESAEKAMAAACQGCHMAHRETLADGSFRIK